MFKLFLSVFLTMQVFVNAAAPRLFYKAASEQFIEEARKKWEVPGVAVAIILDGKLVLCKGFGVRKEGEPALVDEKTLFAIGSTTKAFTTAALSILVQEKKISWDDPVGKYLKGFYLFNPYVSENVTIKDLVTHRTGLQASEGDLLWYKSGLSRSDIMKRIRFLKPHTGFRETFAYQNVLYLAAGEIVAKVSGMSWDEFVKKRIFDPLQMNESYTDLSFLSAQKNIASPHYFISGEVQALPWFSIDNIAPAGSIVSSAEDMAKWLSIQLQEGGDLINHDLVKEMQSPQMIISEPKFKKFFPNSNFFNYGLGWAVADFHGRKLVEHDGVVNGMTANIALIPEEKIGIVVLINRYMSLLSKDITYTLFEKLMGVKPTHWNKVLSQVLQEHNAPEKEAIQKMEKEHVLGTNPTLPLDAYTGTYKNDPYGPITVTLENGTLFMQFFKTKAALQHWHYDTFRFVVQDPTMVKPLVPFCLNASGKVAELQIPLLVEGEVFTKE